MRISIGKLSLLKFFKLKLNIDFIFFKSIENSLIGFESGKPKGVCIYICGLKKYSTVNDACSTHPHNYLIQVLSETGIIGLCFYLFVLIFLIKEIYKSINLKKHGNLKDIEYFVYLSLLINLWPFFPSGNLFNNWLSFILYFPLGLYLYAKDYKDERI